MKKRKIIQQDLDNNDWQKIELMDFDSSQKDIISFFKESGNKPIEVLKIPFTNIRIRGGPLAKIKAINSVFHKNGGEYGLKTSVHLHGFSWQQKKYKIYKLTY